MLWKPNLNNTDLRLYDLRRRTKKIVINNLVNKYLLDYIGHKKESLVSCCFMSRLLSYPHTLWQNPLFDIFKAHIGYVWRRVHYIFRNSYKDYRSWGGFLTKVLVYLPGSHILWFGNGKKKDNYRIR